MKFKITAATNDNVKEMIKAYPILKDFRIALSGRYPWGSENNTIIASIEIQTIEDLLKLIEAVKCPLIVGENAITIYDDYVE